MNDTSAATLPARGTASARVARTVLLVAFTLVALAVLAGTAAASTQWAHLEQRMANHINADRRGSGLGQLGVEVTLQHVARSWSGVMASQDRLYHNPNLAAQMPASYRRLGENVGYRQHPGATETQMLDRMHQMFMESPGHRANVLRPEFNWVGVGVRITSSGKMWVTVTFMQGPGQAATPPPPPLPPLGPGEFRDVSGGTHAPAIKAISLEGITKGCDGEHYCPNRKVTRGQMAAFLTRALNLDTSGRDYFGDDGVSAHQAAINALAAAGVADGCGAGSFCPNEPISRGQMATFLQRALDLPIISVNLFSDIGVSVHVPAINALAVAGITQGCDAGLYCPSVAVSRAEMASFLARALDLV